MVVLLLAILLPQSPEDQVRELQARLAAHRAAPLDPKDPKFGEWDAKLFDLDWDCGTALYRLAEQRKSPELYKEVVRHFTRFVWERDTWLAALQAQVYIGRANHALQDWGPCLAAFRAARRIETAEDRRDPVRVEIATRSLAGELRARAAGARGMDAAVKEAEAHLQAFLAQRETPPFLALRLDLARGLHTLRRRTDCERALVEILDRHEDDEFGDQALEMLADLVGGPVHVRRLADRRFDGHHFTAALALYRRLEATPEVWLRRGLCYLHLRRPYEAAEALQAACAAAGPHRLEAAVALERAFRRIVVDLDDATYRGRLEAHRAWMTANLDPKQLGPVTLATLADARAAEGKFREAAELYARIGPDDEPHARALHALGWCRYKLKEYEAAAGAFRGYLALKNRTPRGSDTALDLACWSLLHLGKAEETLALTEKSAPADPVYGEWRLAHRVDALARLGRFREAQETLAAMKEEVASKAVIRALERLSAGYEEAIGRGGDRKLWGAYARAVVRLSEATYQPLRGEKLVAAADALSLEETRESYALAFDLYGQFLAARTPRETERQAVEYRQAVAAAGCGKLEAAAQIAADLARSNPHNGSWLELQADIAAARAAAEPRGPRRTEFLDDALRIYGDLATARRNRDEHYFRLSWKYAGALFERAPDRARTYFDIMERKGYGRWDEGQWGYQEKMETLRKRVRAVTP